MLSLLCVAAADAQGDSIVRDLQRVDVVARGKNDAVRATIPMQRIDAEKMRLLGIHSLTDALKHFAGTTVRDYGGAGGMKTVSVRGIGARHTAVVYDGIALSDCQTGEIDLSRFSLEQFGSLRLEIGDGDNIFQPARNQAAAATLVLESSPDITHQSSPITHSPSPFGEGWGGALIFGSFGLVSPSVRLSQPLSEKLALSAFGEFFHADNDYPFTLHNVTLTSRERRTNSRMNTGRGELNLHWMPSASVQLSAKGYFYHSHRHLPGIVRYYTNENHERLTDQNAFGQLRLRAQLAERWALLLNAKFDWAHTDYENRTPGSALGDARYWQRESYGSAALLFEPTHWLSLDYSADFQRNTLNSTLSIYDEHPRRNLFLQSFAAKAQWPRLTLVARALWSIANESERENHSSFDPSLSLSYRLLPREELYLRAMAKRIYRLPTFTELYFYHIGAAQLQPERATQFNVGLTWRKSHFSLTADAYYNRVTEKIVAVPFNIFVWRIANIDRAHILGLDVTGFASQSFGQHRLSLSANYSLQRAMNGTVKDAPDYHKQLPYTPIHSLTATISWENPWTNLALTTSGQSARWTSTDHAAGTRIAGFSTTDVSLWRTLLGDRLTARVTLQNLFDRQYDLVAHYPMPGRSWRLNLSFKI